MKEYTRKVKVRAGQWFPGDHNLYAELGLIIPIRPDGSFDDSRQLGVIRSLNGDSVVHPGDWVVHDGDDVRVVPADRFANEYAPAAEPAPAPVPAPAKP